MEEEDKSLDEFIINAFHKGSNTILIGEIHNKCNTLHNLIRILRGNNEMFLDKKIAIFYENYPALGFRHSTPYAKKDINKYESSKALRKKLSKLISKDIKVYGLETKVSDPFLELKDPAFKKDNMTGKKFEKIVKKLKLKETFFERHQKTVSQYYEDSDVNTTLIMTADLYGQSDERITKPGKIFCNIIKKEPKDTLCIIIVGNAHLPKVYRKNGNTLIDEGLAIRLKKSSRTRNLFSTAALPQGHTDKNYYEVIERECVFEKIENVCFLLREIYHKDDKSGFFASTSSNSNPTEEITLLDSSDSSSENLLNKRCCSFCYCCKN